MHYSVIYKPNPANLRPCPAQSFAFLLPTYIYIPSFF